MTLIENVPFVPNTDDGMHCYQSSFLMLLRHFLPERSWSMTDAEEITDKRTDETAWPIAGPLWLVRHGFDVRVTFDFDYRAMSNEGNTYSRRRYGDEVADWQRQRGSNFVDNDLAKAFLADVDIQQSVPKFSDITDSLERGGLAICGVNSRRLNGEDGYVGHNVVIFGIDETYVLLHNPGPPPIEGQRVSRGDFAAAWSHPDDSGRYLMTVRPAGEPRMS